MVCARKAILWVLPGLCTGLLVLPAGALAGATGGTAGPATNPPAAPTPAPTATGGALAVSPATLLQDQVAVVSGTVAQADAGRPVWLQVRTARGAWTTVQTGTAGADGQFTIAWRASRAGELTLRAVSFGVASTSAVTATPEVTVSVFRQVIATWYGKGLFGRHTACGELLTKHIVGVADRTLPCGTPVTVSYNGVTVTLPVIDRGPYDRATLDLTLAAAQELGFVSTGAGPVEMLAGSGTMAAPDWFAPGSAPSGPTGSSGTAVDGGATAPSA
jgi:hypothetical protein